MSPMGLHKFVLAILTISHNAVEKTKLRLFSAQPRRKNFVFLVPLKRRSFVGLNHSNIAAPAIRLVLQFESKTNRTTARPTKRIEHEQKFVRWPLFESKTNRTNEFRASCAASGTYRCTAHGAACTLSEKKFKYVAKFQVSS